MRSLPVFSSLEPLEARIAPATIFVGNSFGYDQSGFYSTNVAKTNYSSSDIFGANFVGGSNTYYIKLVAGDKVMAADNGGAFNDTLIQVKSGTVIAFFTDLGAHDGTYELGELTGLSLSQNASLTVNGSVNGDIVSNLAFVKTPAAGQDNYQIQKTSLIGTSQNLNSLVVHDANSILVGGKISNVTGNNIGKILAGSAANGISYDFNLTDSGGGGTLVVSAVDKQAGPSISNVKVNSLGDPNGLPNMEGGVLRAGDGGAGAAGGSVTGVTIISDSDGFLIAAGNGGNGNGVVSNGGAGGAVSTVYIQGNVDGSPNSAGVDPGTYGSDSTLPSIQVLAGKGGDGFLASSGNGGAGGKLNSIYVGYELVSGKVQKSTFLVQDSVLLQAGPGGAGKVGGAGGGVTTASVLTTTPNVLNPFYEIQVSAGTGGANIVTVAGGKAGAGGSLTGIDVRDINAASLSTDILLSAGDGGVSTASGAAGGSITNATLTGYDLTLQAGNGSDGTGGFGVSAGAGGSITGVTVPISTEGVIPGTVTLAAGHGGSAAFGAGAAGGGVTNLLVDGVDLTALNISSGFGGSGSNGNGGVGGSISNLKMIDGDFTASLSGTFNLTAGAGGHGSKAGGAGGSISAVSFFGDDLSFAVQAGNGGDGGGANGGAGGKISNSSFNTLDTNGPATYTGSIISGNGGNGGGASGAGGAGGDISAVAGAADFSSQIIGGHGGTGIKAAGKGASLTNINVIARADSALAQAGAAGSAGTLAGAGGSVSKANVIGHMDISILAGDGAFGGAGGSISNVGYSDSTLGQEPVGTVTIKAGNGSGGQSLAGAGGSINTLAGYVGDSGITKISAGNGGGSTDLKKSAVGGSILHVSLNGGGFGVGNELQIMAGDAGSASSAPTGAKGGDVKDVAVEKIGAGTIIRYIVAGDGSNGLNAGGAGGSIDQISVLGGFGYTADIGVRSGEIFGYNTMGGLFAGAGGTASNVTGKAGLSGSVTNVNADAIASIVAGKMVNGDTIQARNLVNKVDKIFLNNTFAPSVNPDGSFSNWSSANMVGAIVDPSAATANTFDLGEGEWVDHTTTDVGVSSTGLTAVAFGIGDQTTAKTDGFVAAVNYPTGTLNHTNFAPQALLTVVNSKLAPGATLPNGTTLSDGTVLPNGSTNSLFLDNDNQ